MTRRFFLGLLLTIAYFALGLFVCSMIRSIGGDKTLFTYLFIGFLTGLGGVMHVIRTRLFLFTPKKGRTAVPRTHLLNAIKALDVGGCQFQVHEDGNSLLLVANSKDNNADIESLFPSSQKRYSIKLTLETKKNRLQFTDRLLRQTQGDTLENVLNRFSGNSGFAHLRFNYINQHGQTLTMNNSRLYQALAKLVTDNGWAFNLKIF